MTDQPATPDLFRFEVPTSAGPFVVIGPDTLPRDEAERIAARIARLLPLLLLEPSEPSAIERALDAARTPSQPDLREALIPIAASMVRLDGGCESGHRAGRWHMHEEPFHALGRRLAALASQPAPAAVREPEPPESERRLLDGNR